MTLPAHTPDRDQLVMTYGEPDDIAGDSPPNTTKVGWAYSAVLPYFQQVVTGPTAELPEMTDSWDETDGETLIVDLISDLMHLATFTGCDTEDVLRAARMHFEAEVGRGYDQ